MPGAASSHHLPRVMQPCMRISGHAKNQRRRLPYTLVTLTAGAPTGLQVLSWNPGPVRDSNPSAVAGHLNGPWHVVCVQEGLDLSAITPRRRTSTRFAKHHCAVLLDKDSSEDGYTCTPIQVPCAFQDSTWALEGKERSGRPSDPVCVSISPWRMST